MSSRRVVHDAGRFQVVEAEHKLASDKTVRRQFVEHPGAVVILPVLDDGRVCLIRNFRIAVGKTLIEAPAGTREPNEPPIVTAERELLEETGYRAAKLTELPSFVMSPGILNERMWCYVATGLTPGDHAREEGEEIENLLVTAEEALAMVHRGEIEDAKTIVTLLQWAGRRE
jgi:ADP-ribose pyrophosphatase